MRPIMRTALVLAALLPAVTPARGETPVPGGVWSRTLKATARERFRSRFLPARGKTMLRPPADPATGRRNVGASKPWLRMR